VLGLELVFLDLFSCSSFLLIKCRLCFLQYTVCPNVLSLLSFFFEVAHMETPRRPECASADEPPSKKPRQGGKSTNRCDCGLPWCQQLKNGAALEEAPVGR
jgi:hypothetical protein